jgi:hypothetical protein
MKLQFAEIKKECKSEKSLNGKILWRKKLLLQTGYKITP